MQRIDRLGQKVLSCLSAECQHRTGPSVGSQAPEPFPEFQALLLFSFLEKRRCCMVPRGQRAAVQLPPRENMTQVNNFLVSVHEGMISIPRPQGFLGCYQLPALPRLGLEEEFPDGRPLLQPRPQKQQLWLPCRRSCTGLWPSVWSLNICVLSWGTVMHGRDRKFWLHMASIQLPSHPPGHGLFRTRGPSLEKVGAWRKGVCCVTGWLAPLPFQGLSFSLDRLKSNLRAETDPVYPCE